MTPHTTPSRISSLPTTIFTTMSRLAVEHGAVNLGQGFPDFNGPDWIIDEALAAMRAGKNQYAPMAGTLSLRRRAGAPDGREIDLVLEETEIVRLKVDPGDELLGRVGGDIGEALFNAAV